MSASDLSELALTYVVTYGAVALGLLVMLAAIGAPLPSTFLVLASGAFVQQGVLEIYSTIAITLAFVVLGDLTSYGMGRLLRKPIVARFGSSPAWMRAEAYFAKRGALAVFLTRCLLTPIAVPINLIAGSSGYSTLRFTGFAAAGELSWLLGYGGLGYAFGSQWEAISDFIGDFSGLLVGLLILGVGIFWLLRRPRAAAGA